MFPQSEKTPQRKAVLNFWKTLQLYISNKLINLANQLMSSENIQTKWTFFLGSKNQMNHLILSGPPTAWNALLIYIYIYCVNKYIYIYVEKNIAKFEKVIVGGNWGECRFCCRLDLCVTTCCSLFSTDASQMEACT